MALTKVIPKYARRNPYANANHSTLTSPDLSWKQQAPADQVINVIHAKSYKIHTLIVFTKMYSQFVVLDTGYALV